MNKRAVTWLLAALLAISASAATPSVRVRAASGESAIVWVAKDRAEQHILVHSRPPVAAVEIALPVQRDAPPSQYLASSLYQRPPPALR